MSEDRVNDLLSAWQEQAARGRDISAADLCADCPELQAELERRIELLRRMNAILLAGRNPHLEGEVITLERDLPTGNQTNANTTIGVESPQPQRPAAVVPGVPEIPGYEIVGVLGHGGMGVVYEARQRRLNRTVALKMVLGGDRADPKQLIRFLAEAEVVASLRHPNVVEVYHFGEHESQPFLALEYCSGGALERRISSSPLPPRRAAEMMAQIADGVHAAHSQGIVHRDLKPHNVLLDAAGKPKVSDFGLAKKGLGGDLTRTNAVLGTPAYMSPEQAGGGTRFVGPESDVWSLGVMFYEMVTGIRPFTGDTQWDTLVAVQKGDYLSPRRLIPDLHRDLELICRKCLSLAPKDRYATAGDLAADLRNWLSELPIVARPAGVLESAAKWVRRNKPAAAAIVGVGLALVAGTAVSTWQAVRASKEADHARQAEDAAEKRAEDERLAREEMGRQKARANQNEQAARDAATASDQVLGMMTGLFRSADPLDIFGDDLLPRSWEKEKAKTADVFLREAANRFRTELKDQPEVKARLLDRIGNSMINLGMFAQAEELLREALSLRQAHFPPDHPDIIASQLGLGRLHFNAGDFETARKMVEAALASQLRTGASEVSVLTTRFHLAAILAFLGDPQAEPLLEGVIVGRTRLQGPNHATTLFAKMAKIAYYLDNGRAKDAPPMFPEVLAAIEAQPEGDFRALCFAVLRFQTAMALLSSALHKNDFLSKAALQKAEGMFRDSLAKLEKLLPPDHHLLVLVRFELAVNLDELGKDQEAEKLHVETLESIRRGIGMAFPKTMVVLETYTDRLVRKNRAPEARTIYDEADRANLDRFGKDNHWRAELLLLRARFEASVKNFDQAAARARDALALIDQGKLTPNRHTAHKLMSAGRALAAATAPRPVQDLGGRLLDHALTVVESAYGARSVELVYMLSDRADLLLVNDFRRAAALIRRAGDIRAQIKEPLEDLDDRFLHYLLGRVEAADGHYAAAREHFARALAVSRKFPPQNLPLRITDAINLAGAMIRSGRSNDAVAVMGEIRKGRIAQKVVEPGLAFTDMILALTRLAAGNRDDFRADLDAMLVRYAGSANAITRTHLALAAGMVPELPGVDRETLAQSLSAAMSKSPNWSYGYRALALLRLRLGDPIEAEHALKKAMTVDRSKPPIDALLQGLLAHARGDDATARSRLQEAEAALGSRPAVFLGQTWSWEDAFLADFLLAELKESLSERVIAPMPRRQE